MNSKSKAFLWVLLFGITIAFIPSLFLVFLNYSDSCTWFHTLSQRLDDYIRVVIERSYSPDIAPPCASAVDIWYPDLIVGIILFSSIFSFFIIRKNSYFRALSRMEAVRTILLSIFSAIIIGLILIILIERSYTNF